MRYWNFFPAESGWGRVPVWGFADVARSTVPDAAPRASASTATSRCRRTSWCGPSRSARRGFVDGSAHRAGLPPVYNQYRRVAADPGYVAALEDRQAVLQPLFMTGWLLADLVADEAAGARSVVIASASSKTAIALAASLARAGRAARSSVSRRRATRPSSRSSAATTGSSPTTRSPSWPPPRPPSSSTWPAMPRFGRPCTSASAITCAQHRRRRHSLGERRARRAPALPGPKPEFFFAPTRIQKRSQDWGARSLQRAHGRGLARVRARLAALARDRASPRAAPPSSARTARRSRGNASPRSGADPPALLSAVG